jgi:uncharacterized phage-associated protein
MPGTPHFEKFDELLVYIAEKSADDDPKFGDLKLNKLLYYADVEAYRRRGTSISATRYQHLEHGPGSVWLPRARDNLIDAGVLEKKRRRVFDFFRTITRARRPARREVFEPGELEIVDEILDRYREFNGNQMADLSHDEPGWKMTSDGEDIPLETALLAPRASPQSIERGKALAERFNW